MLPSSMPEAPSVAPSSERIEPPKDSESELANTPSAAASTDLSSPTVVELLTASLNVGPYVPCSEEGTDTTTKLILPGEPPPEPTLVSLSTNELPDVTPAPPSV